MVKIPQLPGLMGAGGKAAPPFHSALKFLQRRVGDDAVTLREVPPLRSQSSVALSHPSPQPPISQQPCLTCPGAI